MCSKCRVLETFCLIRYGIAMMRRMIQKYTQIALLLACLMPQAALANEADAAAADDASEGTNLPVPRFVSLRSDEVNARVGPGTQYAIRWVYRRAGLPVEVIEQHEHWRKIRDSQGETSWLHKSMLSGKRMAIIKDEVRLLLREPEAGTGIVVRAEPNVMAEIVACEPEWCRLQVSGRKGWLPKTQFFGAYPAEKF
jgi:SH3-like domain-containing protein